MEKFLQELKRRKVFNVATFYVVASWLILQVADTLFPAFEIPDSAIRLLVVSLAAGFPICLFITWAFDWTSQGLMITQEAEPNEKVTLRSRDYATILVLLLLSGVVAFQQFVLYTASLSRNESASDSLIRSAEANEGAVDSLNDNFFCSAGGSDPTKCRHVDCGIASRKSQSRSEQCLFCSRDARRDS